MARELPETRDVTARAEEERASMESKAMIFLTRQNPRNEERAMREIERIAKIPEFAETAFYSYPRSNREIFGPSINLAQEMIRIWGNATTKMTIPYEDEDQFAIDVLAWDFETNYSMQRQIIIKKLIQRKDWAGRTQWIQPDERDKRELMERHHSLLRRNCILSIFPRWFVDKIVGIARETVKKRAGKANIEELRQKLQKEFESMGIYREQVEAYLGHSYSATTVEEITELQGIIRSIRDGVTNRNDYFGPEAPKKGAPQPEKQDITLDQVLKGEVEHEGSKEGPSAPPQEATPQEEAPGPQPPPEKGAPEESVEPRDAQILEEFKKSLPKCATATEVQKYMKEGPQAKSLEMEGSGEEPRITRQQIDAIKRIAAKKGFSVNPDVLGGISYSRASRLIREMQREDFDPEELYGGFGEAVGKLLF